jgi:hypothetical protein
VPTVKVIEPPAGHKDLRAWRQAGANHADLAELIERADGLSLAVEVRS